jgi:hypothetical protein
VDREAAPLRLAHGVRASLATTSLSDPDLSVQLDAIQARCNDIGDALARACFAYPNDRSGGRHSQAARQAQN